MMTPWYPPSIKPVRDGLYITRYIYLTGRPGDCWFVARWDCKTNAWYSAGSQGTDDIDVIGARGYQNAHEWRGLKEQI